MPTKKSAAHNIAELFDAGMAVTPSPELERVAAQFSVAMTPHMLSLVDSQDQNDPIAAQFIPTVKELDTSPEEMADPIGDAAHSPVEGIVHRYPDRVLLKLTHICAVYCRFCFRREQVGTAGHALSAETLDKAISYIAQHTEIWEVILTGGDPLILSDRRLAEIVSRLNAIEHVKILRIHTRIPVADPARVTPELISALRGRMPVYVLLHCNHARELTAEARAACAALVDAGIPMLSQSVLLRGVNDNAEALEELMRALVEIRVKPHHIYHLDRARGTSHFRVPLKEAQSLLRGLRGNVSGLCQPNLLLDIPGGAGKIPIGPVFAKNDGNEWEIEDFKGLRHRYRDGIAN